MTTVIINANIWKLFYTLKYKKAVTFHPRDTARRKIRKSYKKRLGIFFWYLNGLFFPFKTLSFSVFY